MKKKEIEALYKILSAVHAVNNDVSIIIKALDNSPKIMPAIKYRLLKAVLLY